MADYGSMKLPEPEEGTPVSNFVHLHVHSDYSLLDGAVKIENLVAKAKRLRMPALALTDHGNMFGVLNFEHLCHCNGINPIVGCEVYVVENDHTSNEKTKYGGKYYHLILLCENETGYKNLSWIDSIAFTEGLHYGKPCIDFKMLEERHEGLICLSACIQGQVPQALINNDDEWAEEVALKYKNLFGPDHYYIEIQNHGLPEQVEAAEKMLKLARKLDIPIVLTNDIHYLDQEDWEAQDALRCIGFKKQLNEPHQTMGGDRHEWYLKTEEEMSQVMKGVGGFTDEVIREMMDNTLKIANMCNLTIHQYKTQELKDCLPRFELPKEFQTHGDDYQKNQDDYVRHIVEKGLIDRYGEVTQEIRDRCEYELGIIFSMGFSGYFLIVWEFINWSKSTWDNVNNRPKHYIPIGPGRGSGAGSLVAYSMGITDIDPFKYGLLFERFLNPERVSMPDFDVDMDFDFRQEIIEHTRDLYHPENVGHIVTFGTLKPKNCIADCCRILGVSIPESTMLKACISENPKAKLKDAFTPPDEKHPDNGQLIPYKDDPRYQKVFELAFKLEGLIRNTGLHASGMVVGLTPLPDWAPVFKDAKTGEVAVQYTMDIIEPCGLVKFDYLGLKTLSLIRYAEDIVNKHKKPGEPLLDTKTVSEEDEKTFDLFCRGDSVAIFQFESPGMQKILRQAQPRKIEELVALNALYRPGPMDCIPQYIDGKWKPETIHYPDPCLEPLLKETYGVMVYQEQVMQVAQKIAGFTLGGADMLRRAMGKKKIEVLMSKKEEFVEGALKQNFTKEHAEEIFDIMVPFAGYGFNKSHAAAYSVLAYRTGWLKANYPAEFMAANLTNEINSTDTLPEYIEEARKMGIKVDPPDINRSDVIFDVVDGRIVFGLKGIKGMGEAVSIHIVEEREKNGPYKSFFDFLKRVDLRMCTKRSLEALIKTGAFDHTGEAEGKNLNRPTLMTNLEDAVAYADKLTAEKQSGQGSLFGEGEDEAIASISEYEFKIIEDIPRMELLNMEKEFIGCFVSGHPLDDYKKAIDRAVTVKSSNILRIGEEEKAAKDLAISSGRSSWELRTFGKTYTALGVLSEIRAITTKAGKQMAFGKLQDYEGSIDLTFFSDAWDTLKNSLSAGEIYALKGRVDLSDKRPEPSFIVTGVENAEKMEEKSIREVHVELDDSFSSQADLQNLKNLIFEKSGNCSVFFHLKTDGTPFVIRANQQLQISNDLDVLHELSDAAFVKSVWTE